MKIKDFRERYELTQRAMADLVGVKNTNSVGDKERKDQDIPEHWIERLEGAGYQVDGVGKRPITLNEDLDASTVVGDGTFRDWDEVPTPPADAPQAPRLEKIDYGQVAGYIEGAYTLAAGMAIQQSDPILADAITAHAKQAGQAWAHWIESEPKVAALLQRMMIGTPMGEVIGVHVAIVFAYVLARQAARAVADTARGGSGQEPTVDGSAGEAAEDYVA